MTRFAWALVAAYSLVAANLWADNWPHWRGPDSDGVVREDRLPIIWSESKNLVWKLSLPGKATGKEVWKIERKSDAVGISREAYASPFLWNEGGRKSLVVLGCDYATGHRLSDGKEIWRLGDLNPKTKYNTTLQMISSPVG